MKKLEEKIHQFLKARNWDKLRPADLAKSIMIEGAELLELFQWENAALEEVKKDKEKMRDIRSELADVLIYALDLSVLLGFDTEKIVLEKLKKANRKYPAKLMKVSRGEHGTDPTYLAIKKAYRKNKK